MSELDDIKARAAEYRRRYYSPPYPIGLPAEETLADLDRAIAIADERAHEILRRVPAEQHMILARERDEARADRDRLWSQLTSTRADALEARAAVGCDECCDALKDNDGLACPALQGNPPCPPRILALKQEVKRTRAAVLAARTLVDLMSEPGHMEDDWSEFLAETEHYETFRRA